MKTSVSLPARACAYSAICFSMLLVSNTVSAGAYWTSSSGEVVRTGSGECWAAAERNTGNVLPECEGVAPKIDTRKENAMPVKAMPVMEAVGDRDQDGVKDDRDQCPDTAVGVKVDASGCELIVDSDGDGIVDDHDDCPNTSAGTPTNNRGCPLQSSIDLSNIEFATATATLSDASQSELDRIAQILQRNDHLKFEVAGHTDNTGNYQRNVNLSQRRAEAVRQYLVDQGVAADRLTAKGYGSDQPVADNASAEGRARNRRVELVLQ